MLQLRQRWLTEDMYVNAKMAAFLRDDPPNKNEVYGIALALAFFLTLAKSEADFGDTNSELEEIASQLVEAQKAADNTAVAKLTARIQKLEQLLDEKNDLYAEQYDNYLSELVRLRTLQRDIRQDFRTPLEKFVDSIQGKVSLEIDVSHPRIPLTVSYSTDHGPSVSIGGKAPSSSPKLSLGKDLQVGIDTKNRKLFVETEKGAMLSYDLGDRRVDLSFPVAKYKLAYFGFDIVLSLRLE